MTSGMKNFIAASLLSLVGAVFVLKFSARIGFASHFSYVLALAYATIYTSFISIALKFTLSRHLPRVGRPLLLAVSLILVIGAIGIVVLTPETSRVSRLAGIAEWVNRFLSGRFPWGLDTMTWPSGLPFLFMLALPFHCAGNVGFLEVIGIALFCAALWYRHRENSSWVGLISLAALLFLPSVTYEVLVRSELLFNMMLIIVLIVVSERYLDTKKFNLPFFVLATFFGLGLSTRTIVGLIYAAYYLYKFRRDIVHGLVFSFVTLSVFGLTLLPFIVWSPRVFFAEGPFSIQMSYLPLTQVVPFILLAALAGWRSSKIEDLFFWTGAILFAIVAAAFLTKAIHVGFPGAVFADKFDISYFIFCTPFLALSLEGSPVLPERAAVI